jgi:menaquinone-dependent protoporphyrinogen oxidase
MTILVAFGSRYGATRGIAERIARRLAGAGFEVTVSAAERVGAVAPYGAFVVGSALYMGHWLRGTRDFVVRNQRVLAARPLWLFSSGPLGVQTVDERGRDVLRAAEPKELRLFRDLVGPRDHRVFQGALDSSRLSGIHRLAIRTAAGRRMLVEGDFRDWPAIDAWANGIARQLDTAQPAVDARA